MEDEALRKLAVVRLEQPNALGPALEELLLKLDGLAMAAHRLVRSAVANPNAVLAGQATRERRAARKEDRPPAPLTRVSPGELDMGGLSLDRLEFLDRQLKYERKHASRPRPGRPAEAKRRLSRGQLFMPSLREHINRLKTDRCKKIAAKIVEAALGGPVDKASGLRKRAPVHVIALEDLGRYKFFADRTKRENRQLMRWSHREVFKWVKMMADLHGFIVAAVPAGYSSRFSAVTGAPGVRTDQVRKEWLGQSWWKGLAEDGNRQPGWKDAQPGDTVVKDGGAGFLDAAGRTSNADENAAGNIAYRFLSPPALHPVYLRIVRQADGRWKVSTRGVFMERFFKECKAGDENSLAWWEEEAEPRKRKKAEGGPDDGDDDANESSDAVKTRRLFIDPTRNINGGRWTEDGPFWGIVRSRAAHHLAGRRGPVSSGDVPY